MSKSTKFEISKFDGKHFAMWKVKLHAILVKDGCAIALKGRDAKPEGMTDAQFEEKDEIAKADIFLALEDKILFNVQTVDTTAKELWESLNRIYEDKSLVNKIYLRRQLYNLKMKDKTSVHDHLNVFNSLVNELLGTGAKLDEEEQATILLCSMPDSWDNLIMSLSHVWKLDMDSVTASLLSEEMRRRSLESSSSTPNSSALVSEEGRGRSRSKGPFKRDKSRGKSKTKRDLKCYYCDKPGHMKKDCWKLRKDSKEDNKAQNAPNANVAHDELVIMGGCGEECLVADCDVSWTIDSGASFHATPSRDFFTTYEANDLGVVKMGNGGVSKIVGKGDVHVVTNTGYRLMLKDVRHIPDLRLNLLSTGVLDDEGFASHFEQGMWKLVRGSLVVAKGKKCCSLYKTGMSLVRGEVNVSSPDLTANLWHRRLGHMGEKGLEVLMKQNLLPKLKGCAIGPCDHCLVGKQRRASFSGTSTRKSEVLELVHTDVCGPMEVKTFSGCSYFVTFIDDASRKVWVYILKSKGDVFDIFKGFHVAVERETGKLLKCLRSDNGGEYSSNGALPAPLRQPVFQFL